MGMHCSGAECVLPDAALAWITRKILAREGDEFEWSSGGCERGVSNVIVSSGCRPRAHPD